MYIDTKFNFYNRVFLIHFIFLECVKRSPPPFSSFYREIIPRFCVDWRPFFWRARGQGGEDTRGEDGLLTILLYRVYVIKTILVYDALFTCTLIHSSRILRDPGPIRNRSSLAINDGVFFQTKDYHHHRNYFLKHHCLNYHLYHCLEHLPLGHRL